MSTDKYRIMLDMAKCKLDEQLKEHTAMDTRASIMLAAAGVLLTVLAGKDLLLRAGTATQVVALASFVLLIISVGLLFHALGQGRYRGLPELRNLCDVEKEQSEAFGLARQIILQNRNESEWNQTTLRRKDNCIKFSALFLSFAVGGLFYVVLMSKNLDVLFADLF